MRMLIAFFVLLAAAVPALAQPDADLSDHLSVQLDAQVLTDYDDSDIWVNGFGGNVTGLWALTASWHVCVRIGLSHWSYDSESTVADMVPPGAQLTHSQSSGQLDIYSLTPTIRFERYEVLPWRLGAFAEAGVGAAHVKTFAVSEVNYTGGGSGTDRFEIDESSTQSQAVVTAGVTYPASESSWFEVLGSYTSILADESVDYFGIGVGFRVWL
jgi:hypothetical protein